MRLSKFLTAMAAVLMLSGCADQLDSYRGTTPPMRFDQFFNGPVKGYGIVQNRSGKIIRRFDVDMLGEWHGNEGSLKEHFVYYDGKTQDRIWHIRKLADNRFVGTAADIIGEARGREEGTAIRWSYVMEVPVGDDTFDMSFDDWMYQMDDNIVMNRNTMTKFGIRVADLTLVMRKQPAK
jgi:hypothetical protein